jgi:hypothetical protein
VNAPAHNFTTAEVFPQTDAERAYRAAISIHLPNEGEVQMACRVQIAMMRDQASAALSRCSDAAYGVLLEVSKQAATAAYAPMEPRRLMLLRSALTLAIDAARALERANK